jgi:putative flippase GtrA
MSRIEALGSGVFTLIREANLFIVVGLAATATHVVTALAVQRVIGLEPFWATMAGYISAVWISYFGNAKLTFRKSALQKAQFIRFITVSGAGLAINQAIVFVCTHQLHWSLKMALVPVVLIVPPSTFVMSKIWAFRSPLKADAG